MRLDEAKQAVAHHAPQSERVSVTREGDRAEILFDGMLVARVGREVAIELGMRLLDAFPTTPSEDEEPF